MDPKHGQQNPQARRAGAELVPGIIHEFLPMLTPGLPVPKIQIVDNPGAAYLARCIWQPGESNTTLKLQKYVLGDEQTLRRIVAHELCHHDEFLTRLAPMPQRQRDLTMRIEGGHGAYFKRLADKFNARYGPDFVTEKSDSAMVQNDGRTYLVLLRKRPDGAISWAWAIKPSARQREYLTGIFEQGSIRGTQPVDPKEYRLVQSQDNIWAQGPGIGRGMARTSDAGVNAKLQALWADPQTLVKTAAVDHMVADVEGLSVRVTLRPKLGYHYEINLLREQDGHYSGTMARLDQEYLAPPYRLEADSIGELTKAAWEITDEGYRIKMDAAARAGDHTRRAALALERSRTQQDVMADFEKAFRKMPSAPRTDWSKPWGYRVEGSVIMADIRRATTKQQVIAQFQRDFPDWTVHQAANELVAESPADRTVQQLSDDSDKLRKLSNELRVALVSRSRQGKFCVSVDLTGLR